MEIQTYTLYGVLIYSTYPPGPLMAVTPSGN